MKSIIIEGPDGAGKTRLCNDLAHLYSLPVHHAGPPAKNDEHAIECCENQLDRMKCGPAIFDRVTPISRMCYQFETLTRYHRAVLETRLYLMVRKCAIVWCDPDKLNHKVEDHDSKTHIEEIERNHVHIINNYADMMAMLPSVIRYNYMFHNPESLMEKLNAEFLRFVR